MIVDQLKLRATLARLDHPKVKLFSAGKVEKISPRQALLLAHSQDYEWAGSEKRVRWMRLMKPAAVWAPCWRTVNAAALQPSIEWIRSVAG